MNLETWLKATDQDATERRADIRPLLEALLRATRQLRAADWNDDASGEQPVWPPRSTP